MTHITRRQLVGGAAAASLAASVLASGDDAAAASESDAQALAEPLRVEQLLVVAYSRVIAAPVLGPAARNGLHRLLGQEVEHVRALEQALASVGGAASSPPSLAAAQSELDHYHVPWSLTQLRTRRAGLKLLIDLESVAENIYFKAIGKLHNPAVLRTCAEIMGCEAQHWTVLSGFLNHGDVTKAVPYPFVGYD